MNNTRFATVIHILTLLASEPDKWLSSEWLAGSIGINPVIVRKELILLNNLGITTSQKGKSGGVRLLRNSEDISLADIYQVVKNSDILGKKNNNTNPRCIVGKQINDVLGKLFDETDALVYHYLKDRTLKEFTDLFD